MDAPFCKLCDGKHYGLCGTKAGRVATERKKRLAALKPPPIAPHHRAWLSAHPERDAGWLASRVSDGFEVHHLDGDHTNNHTENLLLIERSGHASLHGWRLKRIVMPSLAKFDRTSYQREYMRKRRARLKG